MYDICGTREDGKVLNCPRGTPSVKVCVKSGSCILLILFINISNYLFLTRLFRFKVFSLLQLNHSYVTIYPVFLLRCFFCWGLLVCFSLRFSIAMLNRNNGTYPLFVQFSFRYPILTHLLFHGSESVTVIVVWLWFLNFPEYCLIIFFLSQMTCFHKKFKVCARPSQAMFVAQKLSLIHYGHKCSK